MGAFLDFLDEVGFGGGGRLESSESSETASSSSELLPASTSASASASSSSESELVDPVVARGAGVTVLVAAIALGDFFFL